MSNEPLSNALDPTTLLTVCGRAEPLLRQLIEAFRGRLPQLLAELRTSAHDCVGDKLRRVAHAPCGVGSIFSTSLAAAVAESEQSAANDPICPASSRCEAIVHSVDDLGRCIGGPMIGELERLFSAVSSAGAAHYDETLVLPRPVSRATTSRNRPPPGVLRAQVEGD